MRFLWHVQGKPEPDLEVEWQEHEKPETDDEEAFFASDAWQQPDEKPAEPKPEPIVQPAPDSGPDFLKEALARLKVIDDSRANRRDRR